MKPSLIGLPSQPRIAIFKHEIVSVLRANPGFHNVSDISHTVIGHKLNHLVEFAKAIGELENEGIIKPATDGTKLFYQLASTADEAQGSTSRSVAGGKEICGASEGCVGWNGSTAPVSQRHDDGLIRPEGDLQSSPAGNPRIYPAQERPSLLRKANEIEFCSAGCGRVASGECDCGAPVCSAHRYGTDGHHDPAGMCGQCYDESIISGARA